MFVGISLDGYIAGPHEEIDWLFTDQDYGLKAFFKTIDTVLLGRRTYDMMVRLGESSYKGMKNYVFSRKIRKGESPEVEFVSSDAAGFVRALRRSTGKDIWLVGGGELFRYLLRRGLVDDILLAVHPVVLGKGIPLFPQKKPNVRLKVRRARPYNTGLVLVEYRVHSKKKLR